MHADCQLTEIYEEVFLCYSEKYMGAAPTNKECGIIITTQALVGRGGGEIFTFA